MSYHDVEVVLDAYLECAVKIDVLWASKDAGDRDTEAEDAERAYTREDFAPSARENAKKDVEDFLALTKMLDTSGWDDEQLGHDFWLTRNSHGTGFWDRYYNNEHEQVGRILTDLAHPYGESAVYVGDDGKLYLYPEANHE